MNDLPFFALLVAAIVLGSTPGGAAVEPGATSAWLEPWPSGAAESRLEALQREIAAHDQRYFRDAAPIINDAEYDALKQELRRLQPPPAGAVGSEAGEGALGDDRAGGEETASHHRPMLSLEKAYSARELDAFHARLVRHLGRERIAYVVEPKFDGIAISLLYEHGRFVRALTRGNGEVGADVTARVREIAGWSEVLRLAPTETRPERLELRGEIYLPWETFHQVNEERESAGELPFAHPRTVAAGTLKARDEELSLLSHLHLVVHGVGAWTPDATRPLSQTELYARLAGWGVPVVPATRAEGGAELAAVVAALGEARSRYPFPTDGAVVKVDGWADQQRLGSGRLAPRWALARKFDPPRAVTQLRAVSWQTGRTGVLTPVAEVAPVEIAGSTIRRVSLHHPDEVVRRDLHADDWVVIEKAGEVIPVLVGVELGRRGVTSQRIQIPLGCPACGAALERRGGLRCLSPACPARLRRRLEYFTSRPALDIPLGPRAIGILVEEGRLRTLPDLYRLDATVLQRVVGGKGAEAVLSALARSPEAPLERFLMGWGVAGVGPVAAQAVARHFGTLGALLEATREELKAVPGLGAARSEELYQALQDTATREEGRTLFELGMGRARPGPASRSAGAGDAESTGAAPRS